MNSTRFVRLLSASVLAWMMCAPMPLAQVKAPADPDAVFNVQSKIYHRADCTSARRCTKKCVVIKLSEAKKRDGRACQVCGGPVVPRGAGQAGGPRPHGADVHSDHTLATGGGHQPAPAP